MARTKAPEAPRFPRLTEPPDETYSLKALRSSGERVTPRNTDTFRKLSQAWHLDAWLYYNTLPECWYPAQFYSRALANIRLYAARKDENGNLEELPPTDWASEQLARIQDPGGGTSSLMSAFGQLMFVAGEGYLLGQVADGVEFWEFLSSSELRLQPATGAVAPKYLRYSYPGGIPEFITDAGPEDFEPVADQAVVYRIWKRHPQYSRLADSPVRAVLPLYQQLLLLEAAGTARAKSRIANAGILAVAQELDFGSADGENEDNPQTDPFAQRLYQAMSRAIAEPNSASAVAPPVIRVPSEMIASGGVWDHLKIHDSLEMYQEDARIEKVVGRIATGLDMPREILEGMGTSNHWCVDDQTEILTEEGWKTHETLASGDTVLTLNHETGRSEWQHVGQVARFDVRDEKMLCLTSQRHSSVTTLNHRWPTAARAGAMVGAAGGHEGKQRNWRTSETLEPDDFLITAAEAVVPTEAWYSDEFVSLIGWVWTDGSCRYREGRTAPAVCIYQSREAHPERVGDLRSMLTTLYGPAVDSFGDQGWGREKNALPAWREARKGEMSIFRLNTAAAREVAKVVGENRRVSLEFVRSLTRGQLEAFIAASVAGDGGHCQPGGRTRSVRAKEREALAAVELAGVLAGYSTRLYATEHSGYGRGKHVQWNLILGVRSIQKVERMEQEQVRYTGIVWCPTTPNRTWFARRDGCSFFTGNTAWQIDDQTWTAHLQPVVQRLVDDLSAAFLRPLAVQEGQENPEELCIGYDNSRVVNHPDRAKDAKDLYAEGVLSAEKLREVAGFSEDDAPTEEEHREFLTIKLRGQAQADVVEGKAGNTDGAGTQTGNTETVKKAPSEQKLQDEDAAVTAALVHRTLGAAELALERCREYAGSKLVTRVKQRKQDRLLTGISGVPTSLVASSLGADNLALLEAPAAAELVKGGCASFVATVTRWGVSEMTARRIASLVETEAAQSLTADAAVLPARVTAYVTKALGG